MSAPTRPGLALSALLLAPLAPLAVAPAAAQPADTILSNGKLVTLDAKSSIAQAIAVADGRILAVGDNATIARLAGPHTRRIDLHGRTVIPGLIDSHIHGIRAGLFTTSEVNWIGTRSIAEAMARLTQAAKGQPQDHWLIVAGGWSENQFAEHRLPTQAEIAAAAPGHPIYIQHFYDSVLLSPAGMASLHIAADTDIPGKGHLENTPDGRPSGWISGNVPAITGMFDKLPVPTEAQSLSGTIEFFHDMNRLGVTGIDDPGGFNITAASYRPLFQIWHEGKLTMRVRFSMFAQRRGHELEDYKASLGVMPMGFGDDMLRFNGIGENVDWAMYNNDHPNDAAKAEYRAIAEWAASNGLTLTQHWYMNTAVDSLLDIFEEVNKTHPIAPLRWSIAHLNDASDATLARMKKLGVGWTLQDATYFDGERMKDEIGADAMRRVPPMVTAAKMRVVIGGGTDAHRVNSYNPFSSLQWMLDGLTVGGMKTRDAAELPSREQALRFYTLGSAWFSFDDTKRGSLEPGKQADLAVLDQDYMSVPTERIGRTQSVLTMLGGKIVYEAK